MTRPARPDGLGAAFHVGPAALALGSLSAAALTFAVESPLRALGALAAAAVTGLATTA